MFVLDGLDEVAERDADFAVKCHWPCKVARRPVAVRGPPGAGPSGGLPQGQGHRAIFGGLPRMSEGDIRTMLLEKIGPLRKKLLQGDRDEGTAS